MSILYFCDICSRAGDLFRHRHEEPSYLIPILSLTYVTVFFRPPSDSKKERTLRIFQLLALLLTHSTDSADVTAVTVHLDSKSTPPVFEFVFSKNKEPVSSHDVERAVKLSQVIRDNASKSCQYFITSLCDYMAMCCSYNQVHLGKHILKLAPPLLTQLDRMIKSHGSKSWQYDFINTNAGDKIIADFATKQSITLLEGLLAMLTCLINVAKRCQKSSVNDPPTPSITGNDLATIGKYTHILRESSIFLRFVDRIPGESFRTLEVFHASSILLWEQVSDAKYKNMIPHLRIIAANPISQFDLQAIGKKYKLSTTKAVVGSPSDEIGSSLPIGDFWNFVQIRAKQKGKLLHGLRHDFLKKYPSLLVWDGNTIAHQTLHCEVKLAMDCLHRQRRGKVIVGVSKQKCLCCEAWFDAMNAKAMNITFILSPGHKKVYAGWRPSGIEDGDKRVINKVWEMVDMIIAEVKRVEAKDLVAAMPLQSQEIDLDASEIDDLRSVINQMKSDGVVYKLIPQDLDTTPPEDITEEAKRTIEEEKRKVKLEKEKADAEKKRVRDEENKAKAMAMKKEKEKERQKEKKKRRRERKKLGDRSRTEDEGDTTMQITQADDSGVVDDDVLANFFE